MKITLSKSQWEFVGRKAGWMKTAEDYVQPIDRPDAFGLDRAGKPQKNPKISDDLGVIPGGKTTEENNTEKNLKWFPPTPAPAPAFYGPWKTSKLEEWAAKNCGGDVYWWLHQVDNTPNASPEHAKTWETIERAMSGDKMAKEELRGMAKKSLTSQYFI